MNRMLDRGIHKEDIPQELYVYSDLATNRWAFADIIEVSVTHDYTRQADGYETWTDYTK